jgi:two-component system response regulator MtrA
MDQKVLLVSNNSRQFSALSFYGFSVQRLPGGSVTADWILTHWPDIILINAAPHPKAAADICRHLRQAAISQPLVALVNPTTNELDQILLLEGGADDCLVMPISHPLLAARLRAHLRRSQQGHESALQVGDLVIDLERGQALQHEAPLDLTPIEFRLLVCLAQHRGSVLTRSQILQLVWGYLVDVDNEKVVDVHVCRLRRKVEHDPAVPSVIQTVPGLGYRLVASEGAS